MKSFALVLLVASAAMAGVVEIEGPSEEVVYDVPPPVYSAVPYEKHAHAYGHVYAHPVVYEKPAIYSAPVVIQGRSTYSEGPVSVRKYHSHSTKVVPSHEVKHFNTHSTQAKKIIHRHNQKEKIIHEHHNHENILKEHNVHKVHLHNVHLQNHHVHLNNVHREHVFQPIYHQEERQAVKVTEEHQTRNTAGETHEHRSSFSESKLEAPAVYAGRHVFAAPPPAVSVVAGPPIAVPVVGAVPVRSYSPVHTQVPVTYAKHSPVIYTGSVPTYTKNVPVTYDAGHVPWTGGSHSGASPVVSYEGPPPVAFSKGSYSSGYH